VKQNPSDSFAEMSAYWKDREPESGRLEERGEEETGKGIVSVVRRVRERVAWNIQMRSHPSFFDEERGTPGSQSLE
jgi:hypothetical protein